MTSSEVKGPCSLAWWLAQRGFHPTLVESAPAPRRGGYMIDFWGPGYEVAERMGLISTLEQVGYHLQALRLVDRNGADVATVGVDAFRAAAGGRFLSLLRSDLALRLYSAASPRTASIFGDSVSALVETPFGVEVQFEHAPEQVFDLVVGADGLHSTIRRLAFGPQPAFERPLNCFVGAFMAEDYPYRDPTAYVSYTVPGRHIARYALRGGASAFFFIFTRPPEAETTDDPSAQRRLLNRLYRGQGWECDAILDALSRCGELYFDRVSQISLPAWSRGRIALIGDAAWCPSLLAGEGASFAMAGAYVLAGELGASPDDHRQAFRRFEEVLRPSVERKQRSALRMKSWFVPESRPGLLLRNALTRLMSVPLLSEFLAGGFVRDDLTLPDYLACATVAA